MKNKLVIVLLGVVLIAGAVGAWWWQAADQERAAVVAVMPALPDLSTSPAMMRDRIVETDTRARGLTKSRAAFGELSRLYHANGFLEEAMQCYAGLERLEPREPRWPHRHATIVAGYGEIETALALWRRVIELAPDYIPARLRAADCLLKMNRGEDASAAYADVLKRDADNAYALLGLARVDFEAARWEQARERLEKLVTQTRFQLGYDLIVSLYEKTGQHDRAVAIRASQKASGAYRDAPDLWVDELIDDCYDPYRLALNAGVLMRTGKADVAAKLLERSIEIAPLDVSSRFQLGALAVEQGNVKVAFEQLERCTTLSPDFADAWAHLSSLQAKLGDKAAAARTLATGLQKCPQSPGLHLMRARNLREAGQREEAVNEFMISSRLRPNEPDAFIELGTTYLELGRNDEAIEQMRLALEAEPGNPLALGILAFSAITAGDEPAARDWLEQVVQQPRVPPPQLAKLTAAFREKFGCEWTRRAAAK